MVSPVQFVPYIITGQVPQKAPAAPAPKSASPQPPCVPSSDVPDPLAPGYVPADYWTCKGVHVDIVVLDPFMDGLPLPGGRSGNFGRLLASIQLDATKLDQLTWEQVAQYIYNIKPYEANKLSQAKEALIRANLSKLDPTADPNQPLSPKLLNSKPLDTLQSWPYASYWLYQFTDKWSPYKRGQVPLITIIAPPLEIKEEKKASPACDAAKLSSKVQSLDAKINEIKEKQAKNPEIKISFKYVDEKGKVVKLSGAEALQKAAEIANSARGKLNSTDCEAVKSTLTALGKAELGVVKAEPPEAPRKLNAED